jgi:hypothetical protein
VRAGVADGLDEAGGLGVVQDDDVPLPDHVRELLGVGPQRRLVDLVLRLAERAAVALGTVQAVVDALGDREELLVALDHHPLGVDVRPARVGEQRLEHLGHAAAARGRVHVPDRAAVEQIARLTGALHDPLEALLVEHALEALEREAAHLDAGEHRHGG